MTRANFAVKAAAQTQIVQTHENHEQNRPAEGMDAGICAESLETAGAGEGGKVKITNKAGLPEPLVRAVSNDPYDRGDADFTVTELLKPARAHALIEQHYDEIEVDASELIYALTGQIGHLILERAGDPRIVERRFFGKVDCGNYGTKTVSGRADFFTDEEETVLTDYKFCSMWAVKDGISSDWTAQSNMLTWLARGEGVWIDRAEIVAIFRDWSKPKSRRERDYPPTQAQVLPVKLWSDADTTEFLFKRIRAILDAKQKLPLCTDEERWKKPDGYAVKRKGAKRADRVVDNLGQAEAMAARAEVEARLRLKDLDGPIEYNVEFRKGQAKRCEDYCMAAPFCEQFQAEKRAQSF
jgi:hypothetical protein